MHRREYLGALGTGVISATAGCVGGNSDTYLSEPDTGYEPADVRFPGYGQRLPDMTITDPLAEEAVETTGRKGDTLMTFFYSHCQTVCPRLISALRNVQMRAIDEGHADTTRFLAVTFDPERDDAERLEGYADRMDVSLADGWRFLRPESPEAAESVVQGEFGVNFERTRPEDMDMYMFNHFALILLVNADDYVERAYTGSTPRWQDIYDDFETLREREG
ncbi:SCO family protein [Halorhabdus amylolytica]|uniref:SCO family protein n=1 Tax=Halorhabdus amylolytica TaxID=2559573 RepID=UPI0010AA12B8|nr:SCO family protein [Halorhabdus amylolytica]